MAPPYGTIEQAIEDLRNGDGLSQSDIVARLNLRLDELDRNADNVRVSISVLGSRSARLQASESRLTREDVRLQDLRSETRDADLAAAVTTMVKAEQTLQIAGDARNQATDLQHINQTMLSLDAVTQQNNAMVEDSTAMTHRLSGQASGLFDLVERFRTTSSGRRSETAAVERAGLRRTA